jgi:hypothetical protein
MRPHLIVFLPEVAHHHPRFRQRPQLFPVQTFIPEPAVKALHKTVLPRAAWLNVERLEPWPFATLTLPQDTVFKSHLQAFMQAKEIELRRCGGGKRCVLASRPIQAWATPPPRPRFKSWIELTAGEN